MVLFIWREDPNPLPVSIDLPIAWAFTGHYEDFGFQILILLKKPV